MKYILSTDSNSVVIGRIVVADDAYVGTDWFEVSADEFAQAAVGATRNADGSYTPAPSISPTITRFTFVSLFTRAEYEAIKAARETDADVAYAFDLLDLADPEFPLTHPAIQSTIPMLVSKTLLTPERGDDILNGRPAPAA